MTLRRSGALETASRKRVESTVPLGRMGSSDDCAGCVLFLCTPAARFITGISCTDHNGHQPAYVQQWDGTKWSRVSDWIAPMTERLRPLLEAAAKDYVSKDPAWPKRTEPCDKSS